MKTVKNRILFFLLFLAHLTLPSLSQTVTVTPSEANISEGESVELTASGATFYRWSPATGLSNTNGSTVMATPYLTTTYTVKGYNPSSTELVENGDFEQGNYGFTSSYQHTTGFIEEGMYAVGENSNTFHWGFSGLAHGGTGNFMIINGATEPGTNVWTEEITVTPNTNYAFSTWISNVSVGGVDEVALLQFSINGVQLGEIFSGINQLYVWEQFYVVWNSGNSTTATITILNQNVEEGGNDFGLDDISFRQLEYVGDAQCAINVQNPEIPLPDNIDSANCVFFPTATDWGIELSWTSANIVSDFNTPLVGDLDDDGLPEIVCFSNDGQTWYDPRKVNKVLVFDGVTKQVKTTISLPTYVTAYDGAAYGLVKTSSRKGLIIIACYDFKLRAYDITSSDPNTPYWVSNENYGSDEGDWAVNVNFADFNHDGHPEIFVRNKIYNAETGVLLATANGGTNTSSSYCHFTHVTHWKMSTSIAADMCNDSRLELILGNEIYDVDITNPNGTSGNAITLVRQITPPSGVPVDGNAQVADFNADGYLDVFISIRDTDGHYGNVYCYVWDVHNNTVSNPLTINTSFSGKSIPMIADIDNDELLEVLIQSGVNGSAEKFQTYKYHPDTQTFSFMWGITTDEDSYSNSITSFDFNQDGLLELMISDQANVRIVNGSGFSHITHNDTIPVYVMNTFPFVAITIMQYPIIADVDNDGNAEIVAVGGERLNIFESAETAWAPTRKVWNQYMYNVTNVNNDLTIPQYQFNNATAFTDPENVVRRPFNNFLQQATTIDQYGRPFYGVTDAEAFLADISNHGDITTLDFTYTNSGDNALNAPYSITVFANHLGGEIIQTITVDNPLQVGDTALQSFNFTAAELCQASDLNNIVVAVNCAGGGIAQNDNLQPECDTNNNTLQIAVELQSEPTYLTETVCDQHLWNGVSYSSSGVFQQTLANTMGCDSLVILNLTVNHSDTVSNIVSVCDSYTWHNQSYSTSGDYFFDTVNDSGCNRLETLHLTVNQSYNNDIAVNSCDGVYNWNGIPYSESGTYQQSFTTVGGCDSIVNMTLNIAEAFETTIDTTVCDAFLWDNSSITESGNYRFQHLMASGCDSVVNLNLTVERTPQLAIHGLTQVAISTDLWPGVYNYCIADSLELEDCDITWECSNPDWILLPHINRYWRRIIAKTLGKATLTVSTQCNSGCDKTFSLEINASYFDTDENLDNVSVFPNPSTGSVTVQGRDIVAVRVFNLLGQKVAEFHFERKDGCTVDLGSFQDAVYIMEISTTHMTLNKKVVLTK